MGEYLRAVLPEDIELLYQWANDETVRKNAFNDGKIQYETHVKWFNNMMDDNNVVQYIYYYNNEPVGQVRLNVSDGDAVLSYSIGAEHRGKGYGKKMLILLEEKIKSENLNITQLIAQIKTENFVSQNVVESLNYNKVFIEYVKII